MIHRRSIYQDRANFIKIASSRFGEAMDKWIEILPKVGGEEITEDELELEMKA
jgi:hypothetical protein